MAQQQTLTILREATAPLRAIDVVKASKDKGFFDKDTLITGLIARDLQKLREHGLAKQNDDKTWVAVKEGEARESTPAPATTKPEGENATPAPKATAQTKVKRAKGTKGSKAEKSETPAKGKPLTPSNKILALRKERGVDILPEELTVLAREEIMDPVEAPRKWPTGKNYSELVLEEVRVRKADAKTKGEKAASSSAGAPRHLPDDAEMGPVNGLCFNVDKCASQAVMILIKGTDEKMACKEDGEELRKSGWRVIKVTEAFMDGHDCWENAVPYTNSGGALGHGFECGRCGRFLQAG